MDIPLDQAKRLFQEANLWMTKQVYSMDTELRVACDAFCGSDTDPNSLKGVFKISATCAEIFRVIAEEAMLDKPVGNPDYRFRSELFKGSIL